MYNATADLILPTSIIGSLPRPAWHTAQLGSRSFLEAMVNARWREQYEDAVSTHLRAQEVAGLDICTDGDAHYDEEIAGWSWQSYPLTHMAGLSREVTLTPPAVANAAPRKVALRLTPQPVKFGTIMPELLAAAVHDDYYKDPVERCWAFSEAINQELNALADAGCPVIQLEEPQIHMVPARGKPFGRLEIPELIKIFINTGKGLRGKTEVWCHTCWGNPAQQRIFRDVQSYQPTLDALNEVDADALTFETRSSGTGDLEAIGRIVTGKKVVIGVIDHHTLQIERPDQVADIIREALKHTPPERMVISSDCGMGREGMSRRHAQYKMVAMVLGTNTVKKELGLPEAPCLAADPKYSLAL